MRTISTNSPLLLALLATVSGCASLSRPSHVALPGYECSIPPTNIDAGSHLEYFHARAVLDAEGRQVRAEWRWARIHRGKPWNIHIGASSNEDRPLTRSDARASIESRWPSRHELRLQLASNPDSRDWLRESSPTYYGHNSLSVAWPELLALSRGAPSLTLLVHSNGKVVEHWPIEPALIEAAAKDIDEGLAALTKRTADYRNQCEATDDINPETIILT